MYFFKAETKWQRALIRKIAKEQNLDQRVVRAIVYYPLLHLKNRIADPIDITPVRLRHLGVWDLKTTATKQQNVTNS